MIAQKSRPGVGTEATEVLAADLNDSSLPKFQVNDPIYEARLAGWLEGFHSRDGLIARLEWEASLWFFCANNRGKRPTDYYAAATDRLWSEAVR